MGDIASFVWETVASGWLLGWLGFGLRVLIAWTLVSICAAALWSLLLCGARRRALPVPMGLLVALPVQKGISPSPRR